MNKAIALLILALLIIVFAPLVTIWALNALFGLEIAYNIGTWFAVLWLSLIVSGSKASVSK